MTADGGEPGADRASKSPGRLPHPAPEAGGEPALPVPEAPTASMAGPPPRPRLRPGVAVTPLVAGLHLRGRGAGVTLEGSRALPLLWKLLSARLAADRVAARRRRSRPRTAAPSCG
ncbi:Putative thiopeptide-lantipeptide biosynthesis related protein OS=Streptomyces glaucescens OX=1907 GN=SGLAU_00745 PE=4 SV=1 [Streptomyces glaucescens]